MTDEAPIPPAPSTAAAPTRIISASRRTDLPGWHAAWLAGRLRRLRTPVHSVFLWTRFPRRLVTPGSLRDALLAVENLFVNLTITGLGGTALEPRVPPTREVLDDLPALLDLLRGEPERLRWRCDPFFPGSPSRDLFGYLCDELASVGVRTCTISLLATRSLKGDLHPQLAAAGIAPWQAPQGAEFVSERAEIAAARGIRLAACATPALEPLVGGIIDRATCVSGELAARLHPRRIPLSLPKDPRQRRACSCVVSDDIGSYTEHPCGSGCAYCYSSAGGPRPTVPPAPHG